MNPSGGACDLVAAAAGLRAGGLFLLATDTLPGFHCRCDDEAAIARIVALKGRAEGKPLLLLAGSRSQVLTVCGQLATWQVDLCDACWPGPFSIILPADAGLSRLVTGGEDGIAVRVPAHAELRDLLLSVGHPLVSTSANRAGASPSPDLVAAVDAFGDEVDGWWPPRPHDGPATASTGPSALVDARSRPPRMLREGPRPLPGGPGGDIGPS